MPVRGALAIAWSRQPPVARVVAVPVWATMAMSLLAACTPAPLQDKACPCASGYRCCPAMMICQPTETACPCPSIALSNPIITSGGTEGPEPQPDGGTADKLRFADTQWVSYTFQGPAEMSPTVAVTADGTGFRLSGSLSNATGGQLVYQGFGLAYDGAHNNGATCVDGSSYTGVAFDVSGRLDNTKLSVGATSPNGLTRIDDPTRGACTDQPSATCFGPRDLVVLETVTNPIHVSFADMVDGKPLIFDKIVNVQWQLDVGTLGTPPRADLTIQNVTFY